MYMLGRPATRTYMYAAAHILLGLVIIATTRALPTTRLLVPGQSEEEFPIPSSISHDNATLFPSGIPWPTTSTSTSQQVPVAYSVPGTAVTLNFTRFGPKIPVIQAMSTVREARRQVQSHLASTAESETKSDRFEYIAPIAPHETSVCAVFAQADGSHGLSWVQMDQVLQGLMQFTSGAGVDRQVHYQALWFKISFSDEGRAGDGFLGCVPVRDRDAAEGARTAHSHVSVQRRDTTLNLVSTPINETILSSPHESHLPSSPLSEVLFPIFGSDLSLAFVWLGNPLPSDKVNAAFDEAFLKIAPFLKTSSREPIPRDTFLSMSMMGKYQIAIQIYGMINLTWSQVNTILIGLWRFTNGIGTVQERQYFRNLSFDVKDENGLVVGYGNLLTVNGNAVVSAANHKKRSTLPPIISTINTSSTSSVHLTHPSSQILSQHPPLPYIWHIQGTPLTLIFTYMGHGLPIREVNAAIRIAIQRIQPAIRMIPDRFIPETGFENHIGTAQVIVTPYEGSELSWWQLGQLLTGLQTFCSVQYKRLLAFEIEGDNFGRLAAGKLWHYDGRDERSNMLI